MDIGFSGPLLKRYLQEEEIVRVRVCVCVFCFVQLVPFVGCFRKTTRFGGSPV